MSTPGVILGDCRAVLPTLPAGSIGHVVSDPPYGITNERYDSASAFVFDPDYWRELARVCGPAAGSLHFGHTSTYHRMACAAEDGGWKVRQMWAWVYRDGMITSAYPREGFDRLAPAMDPILYATRGKVLLNAEREGNAGWLRERNTPRAAALTLSGRSSPVRATTAVGHYPRTLVSDGAEPFAYFALPRAGRYRTTDHPNEKPLALMRWLVGKLPPAGPVLDPFCGSGTTLVAAAELGFAAVGIESNPAYVEIARGRLVESPASLFTEATA